MFACLVEFQIFKDFQEVHGGFAKDTEHVYSDDKIFKCVRL